MNTPHPLRQRHSAASLNPLPRRLCHNFSLSLRMTQGSAAISLSSSYYGIASVISLLRNDITKLSPCREKKWVFKIFKVSNIFV